MISRFTSRRSVAWVVLVSAGFTVHAQNGEETALDRYIRKPDPSYRWKLERTIPGDDAATYVLELTSQTWRTAAEVDRPVWRHWLTIVVPKSVRYKTGLLFIGSGENSDPIPEAAPKRLAFMAAASGTVCAEIHNVPNQPLSFADSPAQPRVEDDIVAYSRIQFMKTGDETWLVRLPMVKSAVRAMDAVQEFLRSDAGGRFNLENFVVAGASKRGWTTWLTAVVDPRVVAIVPLVIDALNSEAITRHHFESYGFFSKALDDYVRHGLFPDKIGTPEYRRVLAIEDPINYRMRDRLKIPKFLVNAAGDEFFLPDNSRLYYSELPEEKRLRYVPNAKHSLEGSDAMESIAAFYQAVLVDKPRPNYSWTIDKDGTIRVTTKDKPREVNLWRATNPNARDFRLDVIGKGYEKSTLSAESDGVYVAREAKPPTGFTASFVELVFDSGGKFPFKFTTDVSVVPDVLPFKFENAPRSTKASP